MIKVRNDAVENDRISGSESCPADGGRAVDGIYWTRTLSRRRRAECGGAEVQDFYRGTSYLRGRKNHEEDQDDPKAWQNQRFQTKSSGAKHPQMNHDRLQRVRGNVQWFHPAHNAVHKGLVLIRCRNLRFPETRMPAEDPATRIQVQQT